MSEFQAPPGDCEQRTWQRTIVQPGFPRHCPASPAGVRKRDANGTDIRISGFGSLLRAAPGLLECSGVDAACQIPYEDAQCSLPSLAAQPMRSATILRTHQSSSFSSSAPAPSPGVRNLPDMAPTAPSRSLNCEWQAIDGEGVYRRRSVAGRCYSRSIQLRRK